MLARISTPIGELAPPSAIVCKGGFLSAMEAQHVKKVEAEVQRLLYANVLTPCINLLEIEHTPTLRAAKKHYRSKIMQIHPDKLGVNVNRDNALAAAWVLTRAYELC